MRAKMVIQTKATDVTKAAPKLTRASQPAVCLTLASRGAILSQKERLWIMAAKLLGKAYSASPASETCAKSSPAQPQDG